MKDFLEIGAHLTSLKSLNLRGIDDQSTIYEIVHFLPEDLVLEKVEIQSNYLKDAVRISDLLLKTELTNRVKYTSIELLKIVKDVNFASPDNEISFRVKEKFCLL